MPPGRGGLIQAFANNHVLEEAERNLLLKALKKLNDYYRLIKQQLQKLALLALTQSLLKIRRIATGQRYARPCGCVDAEADFLVSLDKNISFNQN